ncbi:unnamed protein product [Bursaphelenchus okinawaensis]|uniref:Uncharacterized protein n=1 Tax=Bursaphelenchus okinawaensis TaxID=465554 RepID=A0A811JU71_9BILA|nr:unnamed protein product [Bursaphelenchus okinawaensis]CAG9084106.1 unnamed protein product [Bursaphelenchus okinawaensis]
MTSFLNSKALSPEAFSYFGDYIIQNWQKRISVRPGYFDVNCINLVWFTCISQKAALFVRRRNLFCLRIRASYRKITDVRVGVMINFEKIKTRDEITEYDYQLLNKRYQEILMVCMPVFSGISFQIDMDRNSIITFYGYSCRKASQAYYDTMNSLIHSKLKINQEMVNYFLNMMKEHLFTVDFCTSDNTCYYRVFPVLMELESIDFRRLSIRIEGGLNPCTLRLLKKHSVKHLELLPCAWQLYLLPKIRIDHAFTVEKLTVNFLYLNQESLLDKIVDRMEVFMELVSIYVEMDVFELKLEISFILNKSSVVRTFDRIIGNTMNPAVEYMAEVAVAQCAYGVRGDVNLHDFEEWD